MPIVNKYVLKKNFNYYAGDGSTQLNKFVTYFFFFLMFTLCAFEEDDCSYRRSYHPEIQIPVVRLTTFVVLLSTHMRSFGFPKNAQVPLPWFTVVRQPRSGCVPPDNIDRRPPGTCRRIVLFFSSRSYPCTHIGVHRKQSFVRLFSTFLPGSNEPGRTQRVCARDRCTTEPCEEWLGEMCRRRG